MRLRSKVAILALNKQQNKGVEYRLVQVHRRGELERMIYKIIRNKHCKSLILDPALACWIWIKLLIGYSGACTKLRTWVIHTHSFIHMYAYTQSISAVAITHVKMVTCARTPSCHSAELRDVYPAVSIFVAGIWLNKRLQGGYAMTFHSMSYTLKKPYELVRV